jgi:hypothetical protein
MQQLCAFEWSAAGECLPGFGGWHSLHLHVGDSALQLLAMAGSLGNLTNTTALNDGSRAALPS